MMQYHRQINETGKKKKTNSKILEIRNTKPGHCSLEAFHKFARSLEPIECTFHIQ